MYFFTNLLEVETNNHLPNPCPGWATTGLLRPARRRSSRDRRALLLSSLLFSRCSLSKVSASPCYLLPALPPGSAASALGRLCPAARGAASAGAGSPHGPRAPARRGPAPGPASRASPALPGRRRALLPTSGATPAIPPPAAAPRGTAPPAHAPPQVRGSCSSRGMWRGRATLTAPVERQLCWWCWVSFSSSPVCAGNACTRREAAGQAAPEGVPFLWGSLLCSPSVSRYCHSWQNRDGVARDFSSLCMHELHPRSCCLETMQEAVSTCLIGLYTRSFCCSGFGRLFISLRK